MLESVTGLIVFCGSLIFMLLVVPWARIKELVSVGTGFGLFFAFSFIYVMQNVFGFWTFHRVDLFNIFGVPFFLALSWIPMVIVFSHLLAQYKNMFMLGVILVGFPLSATIIHLIMLDTKTLTYNNWNLLLTFLVSFGIHLVIMYYLYATKRLANLKGIIGA